jgi:hypothetical protein
LYTAAVEASANFLFGQPLLTANPGFAVPSVEKPMRLNGQIQQRIILG